MSGLPLSPLSALSPLGSVEALQVKTAQVAPQPRLVRAAHEFEAAMMKELLAPLESGKDLMGESDSISGDDESNGSGGAETPFGGSNAALSSFAGEALGKAISEHGGFGIADSIIARLSRNTGAGEGVDSNHTGNQSGSMGPKKPAPKSPR